MAPQRHRVLAVLALAVLAVLAVLVGILPGCTAQRDDDDAGGLDAGPAAVDDECVENADCPTNGDCRAGVCDTIGLVCSDDTDCGEHFVCFNNDSCVVPEACDLPCCRDDDCSALEVCTDFSCTPLFCTREEDCEVIVGETVGTGCFSSDQCPAGTSCVGADETESECIEDAAADCQERGGERRLAITPDGSIANLCFVDGRCLGGYCGLR